MSMDFTKLQAGFKEYLLVSGEISQEEFDARPNSVSIFSHMEEFKDYLKEEYDCTDVSIFSMNINDLMKMDVENGKLIDPNAQTKDKDIDSTGAAEESVQQDDEFSTQSSEMKEETTSIPDSEMAAAANGTVTEQIGDETTSGGIIAENTEFITNILNNLMQDETFKSAIDGDSNGEISDEELETFLDAIKDYDDDATNISLEDLVAAIKDIQEGKFNPIEEEEEAEIEPKEIEEVQQPTQMSNANNYSGGGSVGGYSGGGLSGDSSLSKPVEKTLDNMTKEELNDELDTAQSDLTEKQDILSSILDGSDPEISELKNTMDEAYETYHKELETVDKDMANQLDNLQEQIDEKEEEIDGKEQEITDQESVVADAQTAYDNAVSSRDNWQDIVSNLENTDTSEMDSAREADVSAKLQSAREQLETAENAIKDAEEAKNKANEKLEELKKEKENLVSGDGDNTLNSLNEQMQELEAQIAEKYPELKQYMDAYNSAKDNYENTKSSKIDDAKSSIAESQAYVNEVQTAINNFDNKQNVKDYYFGALGEDIINFADQFVGYNEADGSADIFLNGNSSREIPWCAAFVEYIIENCGDYDSVPDWYKSIDNKWYCPNIYNAANSANAFVDRSEAQTGDIVLFDPQGDGEQDHVGVVVSIENGVVTTIEGNTSNQVAYRTYSLDDSSLTFCKIT